MRSDYERLRRDALERGALGWRWGGSVLARAGVAAWIRAWSEHAAAGEEAIVTSRDPAAIEHADARAARFDERRGCRG